MGEVYLFNKRFLTLYHLPRHMSMRPCCIYLSKVLCNHWISYKCDKCWKRNRDGIESICNIPDENWVRKFLSEKANFSFVNHQHDFWGATILLFLPFKSRDQSGQQRDHLAFTVTVLLGTTKPLEVCNKWAFRQIGSDLVMEWLPLKHYWAQKH